MDLGIGLGLPFRRGLELRFWGMVYRSAGKELDELPYYQ